VTNVVDAPDVNGPEAPGSPGEGDGQDEHRGRRRLVVGVLAVAIVLILAMWVYAFGFADKRSLYRVSDRAWAVNAESRCKAAVKELDGLADFRRIDQVGADALQQKAAIVDKANDIVTRMVDDLSVDAPARSEDGSDAQKWIADYRTYLANRRVFADQLRRGQNKPFAEAEIDGSPITNFLTDFAIGNDMTSCAPPTDLAN
jgi:hypothetical protein